MKISINTRWARAGAAQAAVIIENVHGLYLRDNALQYLGSMLPPLTVEFNRRLAEMRRLEKGSRRKRLTTR